MRLHLLHIIIAAILATFTSAASGWQPDVLGEGFEMRYVEQPDDYSGPVRSTIVRSRSACAEGVGVLYVHGFNDYFFQKEMAREFTDHCYDFYAVDLRKYGRSILPGQRMFELRDISEYFADIDSAIVQMKADGIRDIILMGHSTGGLTTAAYMASNPDPAIRALVLNSPFLDWNQSKFQEKFLIPAVRSFSPLMKKLNIPQGDSDSYARSLLKSMDGEWEYDTDWKLTVSPPVEASWIAAIDAATAPHPPLGYMTNCIHPRFVYEALSAPDNQDPGIRARFVGIQGNAAPLTHEQLQSATDLLTSDPVSFARDSAALGELAPLQVFGGCCGTDGRHLEQLAGMVGD